MTEGLGDMAFAGPAGTDNEDGDFFLDKAAGGKVYNQGPFLIVKAESNPSRVLWLRKFALRMANASFF